MGLAHLLFELTGMQGGIRQARIFGHFEKTTFFVDIIIKTLIFEFVTI